jgi:hypothetical protein
MQLNAIPTLGHSGVLTSYLTAVKWMFHGGALLQEGYTKVSQALLSTEIQLKDP